MSKRALQRQIDILERIIRDVEDAHDQLLLAAQDGDSRPSLVLGALAWEDTRAQLEEIQLQKIEDLLSSHDKPDEADEHE